MLQGLEQLYKNKHCSPAFKTKEEYARFRLQTSNSKSLGQLPSMACMDMSSFKCHHCAHLRSGWCPEEAAPLSPVWAINSSTAPRGTLMFVTSPSRWLWKNINQGEGNESILCHQRCKCWQTCQLHWLKALLGKQHGQGGKGQHLTPKRVTVYIIGSIFPTYEKLAVICWPWPLIVIKAHIMAFITIYWPGADHTWHSKPDTSPRSPVLIEATL